MMKVYISKYRDHWISPYTILEKILFWKTDFDLYDDPRYKKWVDLLTPISETIQKILNIIHPKIDYVKIDRYDTWSMDHTLGIIVLPMLKQLKETKQGSPYVDDDDVPEELKSTSAPPRKNLWDTDDNFHQRWTYVIDEMIFAFEHMNDDSWEDEYRSGEIDFVMTPVNDNGEVVAKKDAKLFRMDDGPNHTYVCDYAGIEVVNKRISNGFRLFGKYFQNLWD